MERRVVAPGQSELAMLGDSPLPERYRVLRVAPRRQREVRQCSQEWSRKAELKAIYIGRRERNAGLFRHGDAVPEAAVGEKMVILTLIPRSIDEQPVSQMVFQAGRSMYRPLGCVIVTEETSRGEQRGVVPNLAIRCALVVVGDQRPARLDDAVAHGFDETRIARRHHVRRDADLEQPDRLEIRTEKEARRAEDVVGVGIGEISLDVAGEDLASEVRQPRIVAGR